MNKLVYLRCGAASYDTNHFIGVRSQWGEAVGFSTQHNTSSGLNQSLRGGGTYAPTSVAKPAAGVWHKITLHLVTNTPGTSNGVVQLWLNDVLLIDRSDVLHLVSSDSGGWRYFSMTPVYGGGVETINATQYLYFDDIKVQTTAFGTSTDSTPPYTDQWSPAKSSTGIAKTNRTVQFHVKDDTGTLSSQGTVSINNIQYTCASGLVCTGGGTTDMTVTRTMGADWSAGSTNNVITSGFRDAAGNIMTAESWSFSVAEDVPVPLSITSPSTLPDATVGSPYVYNMLVTGGRSPYSWSWVSGTLPVGSVMTTDGEFSTVANIDHPYNFTFRVTDDLGATADKAFSFRVNPAVPTGQVTTNASTIEDTYISDSAPGTNFSTDNTVIIKQKPLGTVYSQVVEKVTTSIPDNVSIVSAKMYKYMNGYAASGGTNPMNTYMYSISGTTPTISTVAWNTFAGTLSSYVALTPVALNLGWYSWDVTSTISTAYSGSQTVVYFATDGGPDGVDGTNRNFVSINGAEGYRPFLSITYMQLVGPEGPSIPGPGKMRPEKFRGTLR